MLASIRAAFTYVQNRMSDVQDAENPRLNPMEHNLANFCCLIIYHVLPPNPKQRVSFSLSRN